MAAQPLGGVRVKKAIIWIAIAGLVAAIAFLAFKPAGGGVRNVDSAGVIAAQGKGAQVIDVRSQGEFDLGHIPGAVNVPLDTLQTAATNWDRNATYVVYCATGARSAEAVKIMGSMGFTNIDHFAQGVQAWTGKLDSGAKTSNEKIQTSGKPVMVEFYTDS
jgi:rhodanese-related sulfurtransferase